jgi:hypothetical protein
LVFIGFKPRLKDAVPKLYRLTVIMDTILDIFGLGDKAWQLATRISQLWQEFHVLVVEVLGLAAVRPKLHYGHHLSRQMEIHKMCTSTFSNERRNRILKRVHRNARHIADPSRVGLSKWADLILEWYGNSDLSGLKPIGLTWQAPRGLAATIKYKCGPGITDIVVSKKMEYREGCLKAGDVVVVQAGVLMQVELCVVAYKSIAHDAFCMCTRMRRSGLELARTQERDICVRIAEVTDKCFTFKNGDKVIVIDRKS